MRYISIGTNQLLEEYFYEVVNSDKIIKPFGGLWSTVYYSPLFNEWLDFIIRNPLYYSRYIIDKNPFAMNCVIISLKDDARILEIQNENDFQQLEKEYHFNFEKLSQEYDGFYLDPFKLLFLKSQYAQDVIHSYSVKSLCLFNLKAIKEYDRGLIEIEPFDYTDGFNCEPFYNTNIIDKSNQIKTLNAEYNFLLETITQNLSSYINDLKKKHLECSSAMITQLIKLEINKRFGEIILSYAKNNNMNEERISNSLAIRTLKRF